MKIRIANENDFPQIFDLIKKHANEDYNCQIMKNSLEKMNKEKDFFHCFVAEVGNKIVGMLIFCSVYRTWTGKSIYFDDIFVEKKYRKKGIGTMLMKAMFKFAEKNGIERVNWQTSENNKKGQAFYEKIGAEITLKKCDCNIYLQKNGKKDTMYMK